jgi:phosphonate degradation associated HDIG domain protein
MNVVRHIEALFLAHGSRCYEGTRGEPVSALAHALQCAQLAEWADADATLVAAALLHDIGHFNDGNSSDDLQDDRHEVRPLPLLREFFGLAVAEPVRLHVAAKRYLVTTLPGYAGGLTPASAHSLGLQGGPMSAQEVQDFDTLPYARQAVALRRWDDLAKVPGKTTPCLDYYLLMLDELRQDAPTSRYQRTGALDVA